MRALVTGGAGCIGSDLAEALLRQGCEVIAFDNLDSGKIEHVQPMLADPRFRFVEGDMLDRNRLDDVVAGCDIVYHLAANPDVKFTPGDSTSKDLEQNVLATYNLLESMRVHQVARMVFASTSAIYGIAEKLPISEDTAARPISLYGATKLGCEGLCSSFANLFGMQCWIFRFANIVGPKVRKKGRTVISDFIAKLTKSPHLLEIPGDGRQAKSYLSSRDCVAGILYGVAHAAKPLNVLNLGCDDFFSVNRIAEMVCEALGLRDVAFHYRGGEGGWPGDVPRFILDVSAINQLGWKASQNSERAVAGAIEAILFTMEIPCRL